MDASQCNYIQTSGERCKGRVEMGAARCVAHASMWSPSAPDTLMDKYPNHEQACKEKGKKFSFQWSRLLLAYPACIPTEPLIELIKRRASSELVTAIVSHIATHTYLLAEFASQVHWNDPHKVDWVHPDEGDWKGRSLPQRTCHPKMTGITRGPQWKELVENVKRLDTMRMPPASPAPTVAVTTTASPEKPSLLDESVLFKDEVVCAQEISIALLWGDAFYSPQMIRVIELACSPVLPDLSQCCQLEGPLKYPPGYLRTLLYVAADRLRGWKYVNGDYPSLINEEMGYVLRVSHLLTWETRTAPNGAQFLVRAVVLRNERVHMPIAYLKELSNILLSAFGTYACQHGAEVRVVSSAVRRYL